MFARRLAAQHGLTVLDLDHVVWSRTEFAKFLPDEEIVGIAQISLSASRVLGTALLLILGHARA